MEINIYQILFQILNFGVVMYILNRVLYKPVMKMLDDRAKKINEGMSQAEKNLKAGEEIEKTKKAEISKARKEASSIIASAELDAKKKADEIIKKAHDKATEEVANMTKAAEKEIENAKAKLQKEAATLAAAMAKKALEGALTAKEVEAVTAKMLKN
jgi:F-type H+-transporting ATPase subunit b